MFCTKCGKEMQEGMKFCPVCGAPTPESRIGGAAGAAAQEALYLGAQEKMAQGDRASLQQAGEDLRKLGDYRDAPALAKQCLEQAEAMRRDELYDRAAEAMRTAPSVLACQQALDELRSIEGWRDVSQILAEEGPQKLEELAAREKAAHAAAVRKRWLIGVACVLCVALVVGGIFGVLILRRMRAYQDAAAALESGDYDTAISTFTELADYKDSAEQVLRARYLQADAYLQDGQYDEAHDAFIDLGTYEDSADRATDATYQKGKALYDGADYSGALAVFEELGDYEDCASLRQDCTYHIAVAYHDAGSYTQAMGLFAELGDYEDSEELWKDCGYNIALGYYNVGSYSQAVDMFDQIGDYEESASYRRSCAYSLAIQDYNSGYYDEALELFRSMEDYQDSSYYICEIEMNTIRGSWLGDTVTFGVYEQDGDTSNGPEPITWRVIRDQDGEWLMLLSEYGLECMPYNTSAANIQWVDSSLRAWLNDEFLNTAFSDNEQYYLGEVVNTGDNVFLLYANEAEDFFDSYDARATEPTAYAASKGATGNWWLASNGLNAMSDAAYVNVYGRVETWGDRMDRTDYCVRPGIWVSVNW